MLKKILLFFVCINSSSVFAVNDFMPLSEITPGMTGVGYSAFEHDRIESFQFEVIDIVYNYFPSRDVILVKLQGELTNRTGVASGMSGSPLYINNKLIGALAYRFGVFMKEPIAGVTPIEEMLQIFEKENKRDIETATVAVHLFPKMMDYLFANNSANFDLVDNFITKNDRHLEKFQPIKTPLIISGMQPRIYRSLAQKFASTSFELLPAGAIHPSKPPADSDLKPGSAVGAVLVSGDFDISAVGTVTYRKGDQILAFGHPIFDSGPVNVPMAKANIITTLASHYASDKFAVSADIIGNIRQDRSSGILGLLGEMPPMIPMQVTVNSPLSEPGQFSFNLVKDRSNYVSLPVFTWLTLVNALESTRLGNADFGLKLDGSISIKGHGDVILKNFYAGSSTGFYSGAGVDIAEAAYDIAMTLGALLVNPFKIPDIEKIELNFTAVPGQNSAIIERVYFDKKYVKPGDELKVIIHLKPYHRGSYIIEKRIQIPTGLTDEKIAVVVGGNKEVTQWDMQINRARFQPDDFDALVNLLNRRPKNNEIILQLRNEDRGAVIHGKDFHDIPPSISRVLDHEKVQKSFDPLREKIVKEWIFSTQYGIQGGRKFDLMVQSVENLY
ncbi:MAG: SpoIVB peptidase S55 domain-containing protein [bacterium]|nr:SpoIVB peptidase S55 domain-containing protein [bacterium]